MRLRRTNPVVIGIALMLLGMLPFAISLLVNTIISTSDPQGQSSIGPFLQNALVDITPICSALLFTAGIVVFGLAALGRIKPVEPDD